MPVFSNAANGTALEPLPETNGYSSSKKPLNKKFIVLGVIVAIVVILTMLFVALSGNNGSGNNASISNDEFNEALEDLGKTYATFSREYEVKIGYIPKLRFDENSSFPKGNFAALKMNFEKFKEANEKVQRFSEKNNSGFSAEQIEKIEKLKKVSNNAIQQFERNVELMEKLYTAFAAPMLEENNETVRTCDKTEEIQSALSDERELVASASEELYIVFCNIMTKIAPNPLMSEYEISQIMTENQARLKLAVDDLDAELSAVEPEELNVSELVQEIQESGEE